MKTDPRVTQLLAAFWSAHGMSVDGPGAAIWLDALRNISPEDLKSAIREFSQRGSGLPTPARLLEFAPEKATIASRATAAWRCVVSAIRRFGAYYSIEFDDPLIHGAVRIVGGWRDLCRLQKEQLDRKEKDFVSAYIRCVMGREADCRPLIGSLGNDRPVRITTSLLQGLTQIPEAAPKVIEHQEAP